MPEKPKPIPLRFWRSTTGREPVRDWLNELPRADQRTVGRDIAKVQFGWPVGLPLCRPLSAGLWEVRSSLPSGREGRVLFGFRGGMLIAPGRIYQEAAEDRSGGHRTCAAEI